MLHTCRSFGFDPLGLGRNPDLLQRFQESELVHSRWAMLGMQSPGQLRLCQCQGSVAKAGTCPGVAGALAVELAGQGSWFDAADWVRFLCTGCLPSAGSQAPAE